MSHLENFGRLIALVVENPGFYEGLSTLVRALKEQRDVYGGRLFLLGVGGGAANAAHAVNDFRKLCGIEAYAPTDGIAELTARANDDGWHSVFVEWLRTSHLGPADTVMVFSVGGGTPDVSSCIHEAVRWAVMEAHAHVIGVVGRLDGTTASLANSVIVVSSLVVEDLGPFLTPVTEAIQMVALHAMVSDPRLQINKTKW